MEAPMRRAPLLFFASLLALAACQRSETRTAPAPTPPPVAAPAPAAPSFRVTSIELGREVGADRRIAAPSSQFTPTDTIYASVVSDGSSPTVTLRARWSYEDGQIVNESSETISPNGPAATEFHIAKPDGWPAGRYRVEISANGSPAGTKEFEVR
jgi:hypothetical protein